MARVETAFGESTRRVNGWVTNTGIEAPPFRVLRGVGHGFLPKTPPGSYQYTGFLPGAVSNRPVIIDPVTIWTQVSGSMMTGLLLMAPGRIAVY